MGVAPFNGRGVGFGFGFGCGFGVGWGFGGAPVNALGIGAGGGCGIGLGLGWGFGAAYGTKYLDSKLRFEGIDFDKMKTENLDQKRRTGFSHVELFILCRGVIVMVRDLAGFIPLPAVVILDKPALETNSGSSQAGVGWGLSWREALFTLGDDALDSGETAMPFIPRQIPLLRKSDTFNHTQAGEDRSTSCSANSLPL